MSNTTNQSVYNIQNTTKIYFQEISVNEKITFDQLKKKVSQGGRFIIFKYQISLFFAVSYRRLSPAIFIEINETTNKYALKFNLYNIFFGWWFIPHGPYDTITSILFNLKGGLDVTGDIMLNIDEQGFTDRKIKYLKTNQLFSKPDKWDLKSYQKSLLKRFEMDFGIRTIVAANYINTEGSKSTRIIGIKTISGHDKYIGNCKEALATEFRSYAHFEFIDLSQKDNNISDLLLSQGQIILDRDKQTA